MTRLSLASGKTSMRGGSTWSAFSPSLNTTRLCLSRSKSLNRLPPSYAYYSTLISCSATFPLYIWYWLQHFRFRAVTLVGLAAR